MRKRRTEGLAVSGVVALGAGCLVAVGVAAGPAVARDKGPHSPKPSGTVTGSAVTLSSNFSHGELQDTAVGSTGCGTNAAGEPAIHVSKAGNVFTSSELGLGGGTELWRGIGATGGATANACNLQYEGQPNGVNGFGASGGDTDLAIAPVAGSNGNYLLYVASLNLGSVAVATSTDNGATWTNVPVQGGLPGDDREWIAAYGAQTSLLTFHDIATNDIDVLRSDSGGAPYAQISQAIPESDYKASFNEIGNIVIDHQNTTGTVPNSSGTTPFWAYQSFVAPSQAPGGALISTANPPYNEAFVAVSDDGGYTWTDRPVPCSANLGQAGNNGLNHEFPNVSVAPDGTLWMTWSDDVNVYSATSADHGSTWSCSGPVSSATSSGQNVMPWIVATSAGEDLVWYGASAPASSTNQAWYVYFAQNTGSGWSAPEALVEVHTGQVCEGGAGCTTGRQLFDDFGVDTDPSGWAHISYSQDSPSLGGSATSTGYAVQTAGTQVGAPN